MSDTSNIDNPGDQTSQGPQWRQLEEKVTKAEARATEAETRLTALRGTALNQAVVLAGFNPSAEGMVGVAVRALITEFEGSVGDDVPTAEAFTALAAQYGVTPDAAGQATTSPPLAAQIAAMQQPGDQLRAIAGADEPDAPLATQIADAQAEGNWGKAMSLKAQRLGQMTA